MRAKSILVGILILAVGATAAAAEDSASTRVSWTVLPFAVVGLQGGTPGEEATANTPLPTPTAADLARGYLEVSSAVGLTVRSNTDWTVQVESLSPTLGTSDDGTFIWSVDSLEVGVGGDFVDVSTDPRVLASGSRGEHELTVDYRVQLPEAGVPSGDYEAVLLYTVTTQ
ncbi:MAG: hypothetical protein R6U88_07140 [Candidatus Bipolaricaulota bacterium]